MSVLSPGGQEKECFWNHLLKGRASKRGAGGAGCSASDTGSEEGVTVKTATMWPVKWSQLLTPH